MDLEFCLGIGYGYEIVGLYEIFVICVLFGKVVYILLCFLVIWVSFWIWVTVDVVVVYLSYELYCVVYEGCCWEEF